MSEKTEPQKDDVKEFVLREMVKPEFTEEVKRVRESINAGNVTVVVSFEADA